MFAPSTASGQFPRILFLFLFMATEKKSISQWPLLIKKPEQNPSTDE